MDLYITICHEREIIFEAKDWVELALYKICSWEETSAKVMRYFVS
jgi:hypothetical protein